MPCGTSPLVTFLTLCGSFGGPSRFPMSAGGFIPQRSSFTTTYVPRAFGGRSCPLRHGGEHPSSRCVLHTVWGGLNQARKEALAKDLKAMHQGGTEEEAKEVLKTTGTLGNILSPHRGLLGDQSSCASCVSSASLAALPVSV